MDAWTLPTSVFVDDREYKIRTDYRAILDIIKYITDPNYEDVAAEIALEIGFPEYEEIPMEDRAPAVDELMKFINMYEEDDKKPKPQLMDWEQDAGMIIPAINRVMGKEIRALDYMHWWTFVGAYMEIGECAFATIVSIRDKKARHKKLEKYEQEFYSDNKDKIDIKRKISDEERERMAKLNAMLG